MVFGYKNENLKNQSKKIVTNKKKKPNSNLRLKDI